MTRRGPRASIHRAICLLFLSTLLAGPSAADPTAMTQLRLAGLRADLQTLSRDLASGERERAEARLANLRAEWEELLRLAASESSLAELSTKTEALEPLLWNLERAVEIEREPPAHFPVVTPRAFGSLGGNNDSCADATVLSVPADTAGTTTGADNDGQATCGSSFFSPDVWFAFTPATFGFYSLDTFGSDYDTVLSVHEGCPGATSNQVACDDDSFGHDSALSFFANSGTTYWIRVSGFNGDSGDFQLRVGLGGTIAGSVTSEETGLPLSDGEIYIYNSNGFVEQIVDPGTDGTYSATIEAGSYFVSANNFEDHIEELYDNIGCQTNSCEPEEGEPVLAITNQTTDGIDFSLPLGGRLSGMVTANDSGEPMELATVRIYDDQLEEVDATFTAADGSYSFGQLLQGAYRITASRSEYRSEVYDDIPCEPSCHPADGAAIPVDLGSETAGIDVGLDRLASISGTVTAQATGEPVNGVRVWLRNDENSNVASAFTSFDGTYTIGGLSDPGPFFLIATGGGMAAEVYDDILCHVPVPECDATAGVPFAITLNESFEGIDFALLPQGSIAGTVEDQLTGDPISGIRVEVYSSSGSFVSSRTTDSSGNYTVDGLEPGSYRVRTDVFFDTNYFDELYEEIPCASGCDVRNGTPVVVALATQTAGIDFTLESGGSISGRVTRASNGSSVSADVLLFDADGNQIGIDFTSGGNYSFVRLPEGTYFLRAHTYGGELADELYQDILCEPTCTVTDGTPVSTTLGVPTTGIDFELEAFPTGTVSGFVRDGSGAPLSGVLVQLQRSNGSTADSTSTAADGSFQLLGVDFDTYFARTSGTDGYADELFDDVPCEPSCNVNDGAPIVVDGDLSGIDFELEAIGGFSGTVTDALTGVPLGSYEVEIWDPNGQLVTRAPVASNGDFEVALEAGIYFASTRSTRYGDHYLDELWADIPCPNGVPAGCDPRTGTPITIFGTNTVDGIDFTLLPPGRISGVVLDVETGNPVSGVDIEIWDSAGNLVDTDFVSGGVYVSDPLIPGEYYVSTDSFFDEPYLDELYEDIPCFQGAPSGCDPTKGTPVLVSPGLTTRHIDFDLLNLDNGDDDGEINFLGTVTDENGQPLAGVAIDLWTSDGEYDQTVYTNGQGLFTRHFYFGDEIYVSTDNGDGLIDEVWRDISCPDGSAYDGLCDPTAGTLLSFGSNQVHFLEITLASSLPFFGDGFESGDASGWSSAVGLLP